MSPRAAERFCRAARVLGVPTLVVALALGACAGSEESGESAPLPVLELGDPVLEIGVVEGDDELVFAALESVVRLPNGMVAISDGGSTRISVFGDDGAFLRSWGSQGEGPGEFRSLSRIYPLGDDSLMAAERHSGRLAVFDLTGELGRLQDGRELTGDSVFVLDSWLAGRFWVDGALTREARQDAMSLLAEYTVPSEAPGYRYALVGAGGEVWVRWPATSSGIHTWTRVGPEGPDAVITTPVAFRPAHLPSHDQVLGIWSDENGVDFARVYELAPTGTSVTPPSWLDRTTGGDTGGDVSGSNESMSEDELMAEIRSAIRQMAGAQEIHYSSNFTYTTDLEALEAFDAPESIVVDFVRGDARGWAGVFSHASIDRICGLAYGFGTPPGWMPGMVICARDIAAPEAGGRP